jgi:hypothetical protein
MAPASSTKDCPIWVGRSWKPTIYTTTDRWGQVLRHSNFGFADTNWGPYTTGFDGRSVDQRLHSTLNFAELEDWISIAVEDPRPPEEIGLPEDRVADAMISYAATSCPTICSLVQHVRLDPVQYDHLAEAMATSSPDTNPRSTANDIGIDYSVGRHVWANGEYAFDNISFHLPDS